MIPQIPKNVKQKMDKATNFKKQSELLAVAFALSGDEDLEKKVDKVRECGSWIQLELIDFGDEVLGKISHANFCKVRLCPMCQWRRSAKLQSQMMDVFAYLEPMGYRYILLTLTIPNPVGDQLRDKVDEMHKAWDRLMKRTEIKRAVKGFYRSLEITHNLDADTYHPHFHAILAVNPSYFQGGLYIKRDRWLEFWQEAMGDPTITQVDVRTLKTELTPSEMSAPNAGELLQARVMKSLLETTKYICKPGQLLDPGDMDMTAERVRIVHQALRARRLIAFGGVFRDARKELGQTSVEGENADLMDSSTGKGTKIGEVSFVWHSGYSQYRVDRIEEVKPDGRQDN